MKPKITLFLFLAAFLAGVSPLVSDAQQRGAWLEQLSSEDSAAINALVLYPDSVRRSIFTACEYPELIVHVAAFQKKTSQQFTSLLAPFSKTEQEDLWNLVRYPGLVHKLVDGGKKTKSEINAIMNDYPEEMRDNGLIYGRNYLEVLQEMDQLNAQSDLVFENMVGSYPLPVRAVFRDLVNYPEVLSLLNDHLQMSVLAGDMYRRDPQWVMHTTDSLSLEIARQNAADAAEWKKSMEDDPEAEKELQDAANEYAADNGYAVSTYSQYLPNYCINQYCTVYPYPYWAGYPYWYPYNYWYPYPYWYDWGFYYGPGGHIVFIGLPSYYFTYWYFYYPHHFHHYPHLCNHYIHYYYGPRHVHTENTGVVHHWVDENSRYLPGDFTSNEANRPEVIRQFGQFQSDWTTQHLQSPGDATDPDQFLQQNQAAYPALNTVSSRDLKNNTAPPSWANPQPVNAPVKQPVIKIQPDQQPNQPAPQPHNQAPAPWNYDQVNPAQQHHQATWDQQQKPPTQNNSVPGQHIPSSPPQQNHPSPAPKPTPAPKSKPK